ncbi:MAG TPA: C39 family peptidase [Ktedonosporobacter sp.]|nr:C39 family peptidase [Ktedonosporobacter sp.]
MLLAVITALLLVVMLLIIVGFAFGAWRKYERHKRGVALSSAVGQSKADQAPPLDRHALAILSLQEGNSVSVEKPEKRGPVPSFPLLSSWYSRPRTLVSIGLLLMVLLTFFVQSGLAGGSLKGLTYGLGISFLKHVEPIDVQPVAHPIPQTASTRLVRIDSASPDQYYTAYQLHVWSYSSCSGIAMAMVMNAYGRHLIAADVLQKEFDLGVWNVQIGLLREEGIAMTAATFGFDASLSHARTLQDIVDISNKGAPVIVSVRDHYYYPNGHIFVIRGGDSQSVAIADSSLQNFQHMTRAQFSGMWQGLSAVLTPRQ